MEQQYGRHRDELAIGGKVDGNQVRVYGELKLRMMYNNPDAIRMFRLCGKKGLPVRLSWYRSNRQEVADY